MNMQVMIATDAMPKPAYGSPCNGCGHCCKKQCCGYAQELMGASIIGPCKALEFEDGRYWCGLARDPARYLDIPHNPLGSAYVSKFVAAGLGFGMGCDSEI